MDKQTETDKALTVSQVATIRNVTRASIYAAIKARRLKSIIVKGKHFILFSDLMEYESSKFRRSPHKGFESGYLTPPQIAEKYGMKQATVYYDIRKGHLKYHRSRYSYFINPEENKEYFQKKMEGVIGIP